MNRLSFVWEKLLTAYRASGEFSQWEAHDLPFRVAFSVELNQRRALTWRNKIIINNVSFCMYVYKYLICYISLTEDNTISHIGRHEGRKSEMVSRVVGSVIKERLDLNLSPGSRKNLVSNIPATFVLIKCLWIEVKAPVGFSLVHWWAREKWQYQEIDCKMIFHHGLLGRNYWTGRLHGASEERTQEEVCVEIWLQPRYMGLGYQVEVWGKAIIENSGNMNSEHRCHLHVPFSYWECFFFTPGKTFSSTKMLVC